VVDIRLNNTSQMATYTKRSDFPYFLRVIGGIDYVHEPLLAPTQDILDAYRKHKGSWDSYERAFLNLISERRIEKAVPRTLFGEPAVLLCSETTPEHCHRRLVAEYLAAHWPSVTIVHL